jgi:hypothetical protein
VLRHSLPLVSLDIHEFTDPLVSLDIHEFTDPLTLIAAEADELESEILWRR